MKRKIQKKVWTRLKLGLLKERRKWIVWKCSSKNVKGKLNNMKQIKTKYWEADIEKSNEFDFLNEEVGQCTSRWR